MPAGDEEADADAPAKAESVDDLFGQPTAAAVDQDASLEALFGTPANAEAGAAESSPAEPVANPFDTSDARTWRDNTGTFEVTGQLVVIFADKVRILKENGKFCTVPMRRLSDADRDFVQQVANMLPAGDVKYVSAPN